MRLLLLVLVILTGALLAEALFDSAIGAWIAVGAVFAIVAIRILSWLSLWPADWPELFDGGD